MYWSLSSIPCQIYCAGHIVVLSNSFCYVTNYPNHSLNLGSLKLDSFLLGSLMQLKSGIPCIGWDWGYPKSWLSWMSQTTHSYSWQVMLHYWLGAQLGPFTTRVAFGWTCDLTMWLGFLTARWPQTGLLTWHLRGLSASVPVSKQMQAQLWNLYKISTGYRQLVIDSRDGS